jgi:hypothetical protein
MNAIAGVVLSAHSLFSFSSQRIAAALDLQRAKSPRPVLMSSGERLRRGGSSGDGFSLPGYWAGAYLHSFTSQLNLSVFWGIGGARRGGLARVKGVLEGV